MRRYRPFLLGWAGLLVLTAASIGWAFLPLGQGKFLVNLAMSVVMAGIVMILFMKLREAAGLVRVAALAGFFWLLILLSLLATDYATRIIDRV